MRIGDIRIKKGFILAPLANVTDPAFRLLCRENGCELTYTEMVNSTALVRINKATLKKAQVHKDDRPVIGQIFGAKIETIKKATKIMAERVNAVDINMGCPDTDVMKIGAGSSLMIKPKKIEDIIKAMKESTEKPITAKIRLGLDNNHINILRNAKIIQDAGADAIAIHGRTTAQKYAGTADWSKILEAKEELDIPIIGNGDITSYSQALDKLKLVDGVMIGRGAMGNPNVFNGEEINKKSQVSHFLKYLKYAKDFEINFEQKKRQSMWFMKGFEGALDLRRKLSSSKSEEEIKSILE